MSPRTDPPSPAAVRGAGPSPAESGAGGRALARGRWTAGFAARCAPALAAGLALATLSVFQADRASAAETAFLALWVTAALMPAAVLAPRPGPEALLGPPLAVLAAWALPAGPARLATVGALLVVVVALAAGKAVTRALAVERGAGQGPDGEGTLADRVPEAPRAGAEARGVGETGPSERRRRAHAQYGPVIVSLALGTQTLLRSELLLAPGVPEAAALIVLPTLAALAVARLASLAGLAGALLTGAAAVTLGPGFTLETTLALLGVAGGADVAGSIARGERLRPATAVIAAGLVVGLLVETRATVAALVAGSLIILAALGRRDDRAPARESGEASRDQDRREGHRKRRRKTPRPVLGSVILTIGLPAIALALALRSPPEALASVFRLPLVFPGLILLAAAPSGRWAPALAAAALGWASALAVPGPAAPAAALAVLALLAVAPPGTLALGVHAAAAARRVAPPVHDVLAAQAVWSAALLVAVAVLASAPWLRSMPATEALSLLGMEPGWIAVAVVVAAALLFAPIGRSATRHLVRRPAAWSGGAVVLALLAALPAPARPVFDGPAVVLRPERPRMAVELPAVPVATVAVYSHLSNGLGLPAGTEVATLALLDDEGRTVASRSLRAGVDSGEWAVRRPDVAALPGVEAPPPWAVWIEGGGGAEGSLERPFFGQYYRTPLELGRPAAMAPRLVVERSSSLPDEVLITVHRVEVAG